MVKKRPTKKQKDPVLAALKRAAKDALELAERTNTPLWVMRDGKIVDARKFPLKPKKKKTA